ncbi:serine hydrolase [Poritiphilus flavus]|uniref:Serine hydrolase n=1 Tax=Poritiphilus flavus TaxID=2697053 RepID=A0A6L9EG00_9FLAO|nr:serine hydrolase [Poritiphilus flavus]NAS13694.1 serine hydrolase [Poritiphilus flavus]
MPNTSLAERLKFHRKSKGLSQEELSNKASVTVRTIQRIENAEVNPHLNTLKLLAVALDIEVNELLPLENPKEETIKKKWLLLLHATPLIGLFIPLCNVLLPLFIWIHKREGNPVYNQHGVKVINFQITALLLFFLSFISLVTVEKWGFFIFIATIPIIIVIVMFNIIYVIRSEKCYYPLAIPFLKFKPIESINTVALFLLILAFSNCTSEPKPQIERLDGSLISKDSITLKIQQLASEANVHGMAVAIFDNKQAVYKNIVGYKDFPNKLVLTDSTNIYGASLSKAVFSVLVMKLVEDKVIDLDTPLESYLPKRIYEYEPLTRWHDDYSDLKNDSLYPKITARMCLAHTTGFPNWRFFEPDKKLKVLFPPGTKYGYSGEGFVYLQVVLEKITGKGLEELAQEIIFEPLQMKNSAYQWQSRFEEDFAYGHMKNGKNYNKDIDNEPRAGSTLETTAEDYIKFLTAVLNQEILSESSYKEIFSPQIRIHSLKHFGPDAAKTTNKYDNINLSCGLGWLSLETPYGQGFSKGGNGSGFQHYSLIFPESGKGILIMTNSENGESIFKELLNYTFADQYTPWEWSNYVPYNH